MNAILNINKFILFTILLISSSVVVFGSSPGGYESPSDTYLNMTKSSIGASTNVQTISGPNTRGLTRAGTKGWDNGFGGGPGGGTIGGSGEGGGVGGGPIAPIGDFSIPMIIGILIIYFVVRGVSSKKKKIM